MNEAILRIRAAMTPELKQLMSHDIAEIRTHIANEDALVEKPPRSAVSALVLSRAQAASTFPLLTMIGVPDAKAVR